MVLHRAETVFSFDGLRRMRVVQIRKGAKKV